MLTFKETCELCAKILTKDATEAYICSYECTYCATCASDQLKFVCPNCTGDLQKRPARKKNKLVFPDQNTVFSTDRLDLISFDQNTYNEIFATATKPEIMQIFGHRNEEEYELECSRYKGGFSTYNLTIQFFQLIEKSSALVIG